MTLLREITTPHSDELTLKIPPEFIDHQVEILIFPVKGQMDHDVQALSDHSASTVTEWLYSDEDLVWK